ncbi:collagen alpha-1(I) chain-like [Cebus imitator]|uniref:collagen alpha-1(I) chain-like n=1 Tax=Cebus imitator TaxID=2715852 RepID=UPI00189C416F|nr:collagen alpha-1(I) chain-like [Cebus imitator]
MARPGEEETPADVQKEGGKPGGLPRSQRLRLGKKVHELTALRELQDFQEALATLRTKKRTGPQRARGPAGSAVPASRRGLPVASRVGGSASAPPRFWPDSSLTSSESRGGQKPGDAPGAVKNGGLFRKIEGALWRGEAASEGARRVWSRGGAGKGGWGAGGSGGAGEGAAGDSEKNKTRAPGNRLPPGPTCARAHLSLPDRGSGAALAEMSSRCSASLPAEGSAGSCASEREVSNWPEPISQMGEGKLALRFRSSRPEPPGLFPRAARGGQGTWPPAPGNTGLASELNFPESLLNQTLQRWRWHLYFFTNLTRDSGAQQGWKPLLKGTSLPRVRMICLLFSASWGRSGGEGLESDYKVMVVCCELTRNGKIQRLVPSSSSGAKEEGNKGFIRACISSVLDFWQRMFLQIKI